MRARLIRLAALVLAMNLLNGQAEADCPLDFGSNPISNNVVVKWEGPCGAPSHSPDPVPIDFSLTEIHEHPTSVPTQTTEPYVGNQFTYDSSKPVDVSNGNPPSQWGSAYESASPSTHVINIEAKNPYQLTPNTAPAPSPPSTTATVGYYPSVQTFTLAPPATIVSDSTPLQRLQSVAANMQGVTASYAVGGVSLTKAAAEKIALNIDIDGLFFRSGRLVLVGTPNASVDFDAAIFLTALRAACDVADPYFSLDAVDGRAWNAQSGQALAEAWGAVKDRFDPHRSFPGGLTTQTISVRRDLPQIWAGLQGRYPELRSRLVFKPLWLKETRFGEILYKADVLLKELTSGVSILKPGMRLRAENIADYVPSDRRSAVNNLALGERGSSQHRQVRLWFDLLPQEEHPHAAVAPSYDSLERSLYSAAMGTKATLTYHVNGDTVDLSSIFPQMFVRRHDIATNQDLPGSDPELDILSGDVNRRAEKYLNAYEELRNLANVFRAYIVSVNVLKKFPAVCGKIQNTPLTQAEKVASPLPEFRPSELVITVATQVKSDKKQRMTRVSAMQSVSGGISLRGKAFYASAGVNSETPFLQEVRSQIDTGLPSGSWQSPSGRQYITFILDESEALRRVPVVASSGLRQR